MTDARFDRIEEQMAHLARAVEDLSEVLRAHGERLDRLDRQLALLLEREAERPWAIPPSNSPTPARRTGSRVAIARSGRETGETRTAGGDHP